MDLHGQRVVVLGGTSGIGLATAKAAARCGAEVTVVSRQPASVDRALAGLPPGARRRAGDLTQPFSTGAILTVDGGAVLA
jgi:NAD(P)-dependent dehydrogenase (short-subunit alcohol dehydrogenase family)